MKVPRMALPTSRSIPATFFNNSKITHSHKPNKERAVVRLLFPFKICKHVCSVLVEMSNLKQRELVHHLSKLQLASAAQCDIIRELHRKGENKPGNNRRK